MNFTEKLKKFPKIETEKIRLRRLRPEDAAALVKYYSNEKDNFVVSFHDVARFEKLIKL